MGNAACSFCMSTKSDKDHKTNSNKLVNKWKFDMPSILLGSPLCVCVFNKRARFTRKKNLLLNNYLLFKPNIKRTTNWSKPQQHTHLHVIDSNEQLITFVSTMIIDKRKKLDQIKGGYKIESGKSRWGLEWIFYIIIQRRL